MHDTISLTDSPSRAKRTHKSTNISAPLWRNGLFVLPYLIVFVALLVIPLFWGMWLSLHKADTFSVGRFVGLSNYVRLFQDHIFLQSVWNTFYFLVLTVPVLSLIGLFLALALNKATFIAAIFRGVFFFPAVLSVTIVTLIWRIVFIPKLGLLATIGGWFGVVPPTFLTSQNLALVAVAIATFWWCLGLPMMLFLSALQQIPGDIYEAAALDNANRWQTLRSITIPSIKRTFLLVVVIEIVLQFQLFGQSWLMTRGGPNNASRPIVLYIYEVAFRRWDVGLGAAASEVLFVLILIAALLQFAVSRRKGE